MSWIADYREWVLVFADIYLRAFHTKKRKQVLSCIAMQGTWPKSFLWLLSASCCQLLMYHRDGEIWTSIDYIAACDHCSCNAAQVFLKLESMIERSGHKEAWHYRHTGRDKSYRLHTCIHSGVNSGQESGDSPSWSTWNRTDVGRSSEREGPTWLLLRTTTGRKLLSVHFDVTQLRTTSLYLFYGWKLIDCCLLLRLR